MLKAASQAWQEAGTQAELGKKILNSVMSTIDWSGYQARWVAEFKQSRLHFYHETRVKCGRQRLHIDRGSSTLGDHTSQ